MAVTERCGACGGRIIRVAPKGAPSPFPHRDYVHVAGRCEGPRKGGTS